MSKTRNAGGGGGIPPSNTVAPVISGTAVVGQTLSSTTGTWIGTPIPTYTYQWYRGANPISGATSSTYTLVQADATFSVTCVVTATNPAGIASATSNALTIIDADAQAFFTASGLTGTTNQSAINQLVVDMKGYGIWTKMKAIYPFIGGTAALHKWNLKDPQDLDAAFRLVFNGGWTHSSTGALPNGTNGYANTFLPTTGNVTQNSAAMGFYNRTNTSVNGGHGLRNSLTSPSQLFEIFERYTDGNFYCYLNDSGGFFGGNTDSRGFFQGSRTGATTIRFNRNTSTFTGTSASNGTSTLNIWIGASNFNNSGQFWNNRELSFFYIGDGLTNTEMQNYYTAVQAYQTTLGRSIGPQTVSDPDAQAFVTAANIEDQVQANAVNQLVIDMKAANIWTKMKAVYPFVGGTAASHKWNLKDPQDTNAAFRLVFLGGWTHSSTGAKPNGTNGYADTFLKPATSLTISSAHFSKYNRNNDLAGIKIDGTLDNVNTQFFQQNYTAANGVIGSSASIATYTATDTRGLFTVTRIANNAIKVFRNSSQVASNTTTITALPNTNVIIGARNDGTIVYYNSYECAFASIGDGLTDTEAANFYTMVQTFNTTLNRQV